MSSDRYPIGTRLRFIKENVEGTVIANFKLPGDICIRWDIGIEASYDEWFLDVHCETVKATTT